MGCFLRQLRFLIFASAVTLSSGEGAEPLRAESDQSFALPLNGTLILENLDGAIHVYGWNFPKVRVGALCKAYTAHRVREIGYHAEVQATSLHIRTSIPSVSGFLADRSGTVEYSLSVPEAARLRLKQNDGEIILEGLRGGQAEIEFRNGRVTALNCYAEIRARAAQGVMEVFFEWWEDLPATFAYVLGHGRMVARLPSAARFRVMAETGHGSIHHQFPLPAPAPKGAGQVLEGATASPAPISLRLRTGSGNINLNAIR